MEPEGRQFSTDSFLLKDIKEKIENKLNTSSNDLHETTYLNDIDIHEILMDFNYYPIAEIRTNMDEYIQFAYNNSSLNQRIMLDLLWFSFYQINNVDETYESYQKSQTDLIYGNEDLGNYNGNSDQATIMRLALRNELKFFTLARAVLYLTKINRHRVENLNPKELIKEANNIVLIGEISTEGDTYIYSLGTKKCVVKLVGNMPYIHGVEIN